MIKCFKDSDIVLINDSFSFLTSLINIIKYEMKLCINKLRDRKYRHACVKTSDLDHHSSYATHKYQICY